jgi:hypothetical protein
MQKTMDGFRSTYHNSPEFQAFLNNRQRSTRLTASAQIGSHSGNQSGDSPSQSGRGNPPPVR